MRVRWSSVVGGLILTLAIVCVSPAVLRGDRRLEGPNRGNPQDVVVLSAISPDEVFGPELGTRGGREKRKLGWIVDLVFWKFNKLLELKTRFLTAISTRSRGRPRPATPSSTAGSGRPSTAEQPVEFEGNRVSLVLPDELFGSAFTVVTDVSKIIGSVILNSARRTQTFIEALKPLLRNAFGIQRSSSAVIGDRLPSQLIIPSVAGGTNPEENESSPAKASLSSEEDESNSQDTNEA